jgi:uncharacterized coiled-coil protein SlyX
MTLADREGLIARIRHLRRLAVLRDRPRDPGADSQTDRLRTLEDRLAHVEQLVEGLQDSVHRESDRQSRLIADLQNQVQPGAMGAALAKDARDRGL